MTLMTAAGEHRDAGHRHLHHGAPFLHVSHHAPENGATENEVGPLFPLLPPPPPIYFPSFYYIFPTHSHCSCHGNINCCCFNDDIFSVLVRFVIYTSKNVKHIVITLNTDIYTVLTVVYTLLSDPLHHVPPAFLFCDAMEIM